MSFGVVTCHYWTSEITAYNMLFDAVRTCCVATFVVLSFFLNAETIERGNFYESYRRIIRLLKPYFVWPVIAFLFYNLIYLFHSRVFMYSFRDLGWQFLFGSTRIEGVMYFNWDLVVITVVLTFVFHFFRGRNRWIVTALLCIADLLWIWTNCNYNLFYRMPFEIRWTLGRLFELFPLAVAGMVLRHFVDFIDGVKMKERKSFRIYIFYVTSFELVWMMLYRQEIDAPFTWAGFGDGHAVQFMMAVMSVIWFYYLPDVSDSVLGGWITRAADTIAGYTQGIYCIHNLVGTVAVVVIGRLVPGKEYTLFSCAVIFLISFAASFFIGKLPIRVFKEIVK